MDLIIFVQVEENYIFQQVIFSYDVNIRGFHGKSGWTTESAFTIWLGTRQQSGGEWLVYGLVQT